MLFVGISHVQSLEFRFRGAHILAHPVPSKLGSRDFGIPGELHDS